MGKTKIEMIDSSKGRGSILVPDKVKINGSEVMVASAEIEAMGDTHGTSAVLVRLEIYPDELIIRGEDEEVEEDRSLDEIRESTLKKHQSRIKGTERKKP